MLYRSQSEKSSPLFLVVGWLAELGFVLIPLGQGADKERDFPNLMALVLAFPVGIIIDSFEIRQPCPMGFQNADQGVFQHLAQLPFERTRKVTAAHSGQGQKGAAAFLPSSLIDVFQNRQQPALKELIMPFWVDRPIPGQLIPIGRFKTEIVAQQPTYRVDQCSLERCFIYQGADMQAIVINGHRDSDADVPQEAELIEGPVRAVAADLGFGEDAGAFGVEEAGKPFLVGEDIPSLFGRGLAPDTSLAGAKRPDPPAGRISYSRFGC